EYDMTIKINPPQGEDHIYYFRRRHRRDTRRTALYDAFWEEFLCLNHIYQDRLQHSHYSFHPMREPGEDNLQSTILLFTSSVRFYI
ncbi:Os11g0688200, partial [Oryza sativa Japonica Group]